MIKNALTKCVNWTVDERNRMRNLYRIKKSLPNADRLKNIHEGQRCFIIGNGPSLLIQDLERLSGEVTFGMNGIYKIFNKTKWRPTYYCIQDRLLITNNFKEINMSDNMNKFIGVAETKRYPKIENAIYIKINTENFYPNLPKFSDDIRKEVFEGYTVTYMCLQIAVYMGFKEIYLLGIDHNYSVTVMPDGSLKEDKNVKDYFAEDNIKKKQSENKQQVNYPQLYKTTLAYESAKLYADEHSIKIFNATRGGKLEVFDRVNIDEFKDKE